MLYFKCTYCILIARKNLNSDSCSGTWDVDVPAAYSAVLDTTGRTAQAPVRVSAGVITQGVSEARLAGATPGAGGVSGAWRGVSGSGTRALIHKPGVTGVMRDTEKLVWSPEVTKDDTAAIYVTFSSAPSHAIKPAHVNTTTSPERSRPYLETLIGVKLIQLKLKLCTILS